MTEPNRTARLGECACRGAMAHWGNHTLRICWPDPPPLGPCRYTEEVRRAALDAGAALRAPAQAVLGAAAEMCPKRNTSPVQPRESETHRVPDTPEPPR